MFLVSLSHPTLTPLGSNCAIPTGFCLRPNSSDPPASPAATDMPLLTELVFLCNGSARKGVPENLSYPVLSNSAARAVAFVHHTQPFHRYPFTSHSSHSFHFSPFTDSCAKIRGLSDLAILNRTFSPWMFCVSRFTFPFSPFTFPRFTDSCPKRSEALQTSLY